MNDPFESLELPDFLKDILKDATSRLLRRRAKESVDFIQRMGDAVPGKQQILCSQVNCVHAATHTYVWPGKIERMAACDPCYRKAQGIAAAMGFELGDPQPVSREIPVPFIYDFAAEPWKASTVSLDVEKVPILEGCKWAVLSLSNSEVTVMAQDVSEAAELHFHPVSELWLRFNYMGEPCILSCTGRPEDTKWFGEDSGRDYLELLEPNWLRFEFEADSLIKLTVEQDV